MSNRPYSARTLATGACAILGVVLLLAGATLSLGTRAIFNADFFADHLAESLNDKRTASYVAEKLTDATLEANEDLILVRPLIKTAAEAVVSSAPFRSVVRNAAKHSHQLLATKGGQDVLLSVSDFGLILKEALAGRPDLAEMIPENAVAVLGDVQNGPMLSISHDTLHYGRILSRWSRIIFILGALLLIVSILMAEDHERVLLRAGISVTAVAVVTLIGYELGADVVARIPQDPALGQALAGIWSTFVNGLWARMLILAGIGILMMAAATAFLEVMNLTAMRDVLHRLFIATPTHRGMRLVRGLALILFGGVMILEPTRSIRLITGISGGVLCFVGLRELARLTVDPAKRLTRQLDENVKANKGNSKVWQRFPMGLVVVAVLLIGATFITESPESHPSRSINSSAMISSGQERLQSRPLNEVVFACTHNAMGAADIDGWLFPNQQVSVRYQLQDGIRALMLDVLPGIPVGNAVKTDLAEGEISREKLEPVLGTQGLDAALRIRERLLEPDDGERDMYLCHGLCELGAQLLVPVLEDIRAFMLANPQEVIIIIIEDTVAADEIAEAFERSGLLDLVWKGDAKAPWPTLGEMVASGGRVLVMGEKDTVGVPWYHLAWDVCQETPYHFSRPEDLSNEPNRGGTGGSLLLMNHWITTPPTSRPRDAQLVNARDVLLNRVEDCRQERGMTPNIIAVDFYRAGNLVEVVKELNRGPWK